MSPVCHELGHYIAAGCAIRFYRVGFRFVWDMPPTFDRAKQVRAAKWGFGAQFLVVALLCVSMLVVYHTWLNAVACGFAIAAFLEWFFYPTSSKYNDFNFLTSRE